MRIRSVVALAVLASLLVAGCRIYDYQLRVHNGTDQVWLIRVNPHFKENNGYGRRAANRRIGGLQSEP